MDLNLTIVYDNSTPQSTLIADWGWSCYIKTGKRNILFDTGGNGRILLHNMKVLQIDPASIDDIVISHPDFDHIGGLSHMLNENSRAKLHLPYSFRGVKYLNPVVHYKEPATLSEGIFLTGELANVEQSLALQGGEGLIVVIGCAHPGAGMIMDTISSFGETHAVIGGLHGFKDFQLLKDIKQVCPTHCTKYKDKIRQLFPEKFLEGGVGQVFSF